MFQDHFSVSKSPFLPYSGKGEYSLFFNLVQCDGSDESYLAVRFSDAVWFAIQCGSRTLGSVDGTLKCVHSTEQYFHVVLFVL